MPLLAPLVAAVSVVVALAAPAAAGDVKPRQLERRVVELTNERRADHGCADVRLRAPIRKAARRHSARMAREDLFEHQLPGEPGLGARLNRAGYRGWDYAAENIAVGYLTARSVVRAWMRSPGHRANILDCGLEHIGVGVVDDGGIVWWTQDFGRK